MENEDPFMKSLLPLTRPPWRSVVASLALQAACVLAILTLSYSVAQKVDVESRYFKLTYIKTELVPYATKYQPRQETTVSDVTDSIIQRDGLNTQ